MTDDTPAVNADYFAQPHRDMVRLPFRLLYLRVEPGRLLLQATGLTPGSLPVFVRYRSGSLSFQIDGSTVYQRPFHPEPGETVTEEVLREALKGVLEWPTR